MDDNADAALVLSMCLTAYGHETVVANCGADGIELAALFAPEIVLLDIGMPGMDGYEVSAALRRHHKLGEVYIAALTGWNDPATRARVISAGFDKHLTKPAKVEVVLDLLENAVA